jgi:eukaryotic-like serine/threonine-protein kinase
VAPTLGESPPSGALPPTVGRFRILDVLAVGGAGTVYAARDPELDRTVALKVLAVEGPDADVRMRRWQREARMMAEVSHPNVVPFYDVGTDEKHVFIAMELVPGGDLGRVLRRRRFSVSETLELFAGVGRGLQAIHDAGLMHLDFKPQNVLVAPDSHPLVADFGLARSQGGPCVESLAPNRSGNVVGTPRYMAPEQIVEGPASAACDQFSFGVALYEALYSRHPFVHTDVESLHAAVLEGRVVPPSGRGVPRRVRDALLRCLRTDPADRFDSMRDVVDVLDSASRPTIHLVALALCAAATGAFAAWAPIG